jgi:hypothetical protein
MIAFLSLPLSSGSGRQGPSKAFGQCSFSSFHPGYVALPHEASDPPSLLCNAAAALPMWPWKRQQRRGPWVSLACWRGHAHQAGPAWKSAYSAMPSPMATHEAQLGTAQWHAMSWLGANGACFGQARQACARLGGAACLLIYTTHRCTVV